MVSTFRLVRPPKRKIMGVAADYVSRTRIGAYFHSARESRKLILVIVAVALLLDNMLLTTVGKQSIQSNKNLPYNLQFHFSKVLFFIKWLVLARQQYLFPFALPFRVNSVNPIYCHFLWSEACCSDRQSGDSSLINKPSYCLHYSLLRLHNEMERPPLLFNDRAFRSIK